MKRSLVVSTLGLTILAVGLGFWLRLRSSTSDDPATRATVSAETGLAFHKSLAALDVDENQLAASLLQQAVEQEPGEPALWANLAVAHLRLRDLSSAASAMQQARATGVDARELDVLEAELLRHSGEIESAIEKLRAIHQQWPDDTAAAYSLVTLLSQLRSEAADAERFALLAEILARHPENLRAQLETSRLAATLQAGEELRSRLARLAQHADAWPTDAQKHLAKAEQAAQSGDFRAAVRSLLYTENLLKQRFEYQDSSAQLGVSHDAVPGSPLRHFLSRQLPAREAAIADAGLTFQRQDPPETAARPDRFLAVEQVGKRRSTLLSLSDKILQPDQSAALPFPGSTQAALRSSIAAVDLNADFRLDLVAVGAEGCRVYLGSEDGAFVSHDEKLPAEFSAPWRSVWAVDVEADGDLDLLLSDHDSSLRWIRNNGDMTFAAAVDVTGARAVRRLQAADLDLDGDAELITLNASGRIQIWMNQRSGAYAAAPNVNLASRLGFAVGDLDGDGRFEIISLSESGLLLTATWSGAETWLETPIASWEPPGSLGPSPPSEIFLAVADFDNNGAVDLLASRQYETSVWLQDTDGQWIHPAGLPQMHVESISDLDQDGLLDLIGSTEDGGQVALGQSTAGYSWQVLQTLANTGAGDQRINSFGIGGRIEIRAGEAAQAASIRSPRTHFGLGRHPRADVARIVWPNGAVQAEFDLQAKASLVARQRLKGSCPWVFAFDGEQFRFVKDFIWRSPLGLRINAQATAGVTQTEDWIKIAGDQLAEADGRYSLRITAELWETHFFDHVSLLVVDHPAESEVLVDERFVPTTAPAQQVWSLSPPQPWQDPVDHRGAAVDDSLHEVDGVYVDGFALGKYQGVTQEHWIAFTVPRHVEPDREIAIVGNGWIYPTDSSLNVALSQGGERRPHGLVLEQQLASGQWRVVRDNLGFPAGKHKDAVIALPPDAVTETRRLRLRTNMEVYWDFLGWSYVLDAPMRMTKLSAEKVDLRPRGYSRLLPIDRRRPDTPLYQVIATRPQWLDLEGFYTRFGDVRELIERVDDRYVIMNAGDELALEFPALPPPAAGKTRDFVLIGDGWVKDGDFNTAFSRFVRPLPAHGDSDYSGPLLPLERDPVYQAHAQDWQTYHTRYVTPRPFPRKLWPARSPGPDGPTGPHRSRLRWRPDQPTGPHRSRLRWRPDQPTGPHRSRLRWRPDQPAGPHRQEEGSKHDH